jgi:hypothetical protein
MDYGSESRAAVAVPGVIGSGEGSGVDVLERGQPHDKLFNIPK